MTHGQLVPEIVKQFDAVDMPTTLQLLKVDSGFNVNWEYELTTGEDGTASLPYMPHDTFQIEEIKALVGYFMPADAAPVSFKVDDQGFIGLDMEGAQFSDTLKITFDSMPTTLEIPGTPEEETDKSGLVKTGDSFLWWAFAALAGAAACAGGSMHLARKSGAPVDEDEDAE